MRRFTMNIVLAVAFLPRVLVAQHAETTAILATVDRFADALRAKDSVAMRAELHEQARFTLLRPPGGPVEVMVFDAGSFLAAVTAPATPVLDEVIRNPQVAVDADLATVWAEYQVRINGALSHCGYNAFHLVRQRGTWRILNVSDTARQEGCGAIW